MLDRRGDEVGLLPAITVGTLLVLYLVWGAMHDLAHGESDLTFEYAALALSVPAFAFLYRGALLRLSSKAKLAWLGGAGLVLLLLNAGAVNARLHPKYALDPMLASVFLAAGVPVLVLIGYHITRETIRRRTGPRF